VAPGSIDVLLEAAGVLEDILNSRGVLALVSAVTLAGAARPAAELAVRVLKTTLRAGKRVTVLTLRATLLALGEEPRGLTAYLVRLEADGTITVVVIETH
jgi:hypothetical protein